MRILAGQDQPDDRRRCASTPGPVALLPAARVRPGPHPVRGGEDGLDELPKAQDEMVQTADALAHCTDETSTRPWPPATTGSRVAPAQRCLHVDHTREVLGGLGFQPEDYDRPVDTFSGGQQRRLMLAKLLLAAPDVMLLDEPSNHLDIDTTRWLEDYLVQQPQAMLIVSHDRYFLNRSSPRSSSCTTGGSPATPATTSSTSDCGRSASSSELKEYEAQQEYIEKQEEYIRRVHYGQLAKQAQSRQKALDKVERVERPTRSRSPRCTSARSAAPATSCSRSRTWARRIDQAAVLAT